MEMNELYSEMILEYSRQDRYRKKLMRPRTRVRGVNPSCGDEISLELAVDNDVITDIAIIGSGCAISMASANMMGSLIEGMTLAEAKKRARIFLDMIQKNDHDEEKLELLEDAQVLQNISRMPARVKCAVLSWHTLDESIDKIEKGEPAPETE